MNKSASSQVMEVKVLDYHCFKEIYLLSVLVSKRVMKNKVKFYLEKLHEASLTNSLLK